MTIPVSTVVRVTITTAPTFPSRAGFGTLLVVGTSGNIPSFERVRTYSSIDGVAEDFASTDEEFKVAQIYFSQNPTPAQLKIGRRVIDPIPAIMAGNPVVSEIDPAIWALISNGSFTINIDGDGQDIIDLDFTASGAILTSNPSNTETDVASWQSITDAGFDIEIDGTPGEVRALNFADTFGTIESGADDGGAESDFNVWLAVTDGGFIININGVGPTAVSDIDFSAPAVANMDDVAAAIESAIQAEVGGGLPYTAATCVWNASSSNFIITSGEAGASSTITAITAGATTDISNMLACDTINVPAITNGEAEVVTVIEVASRITTGLISSGVVGTCSFTGTSFVITSSVTGVGSTISDFLSPPDTGTPIEGLMGMGVADDPVAVQGGSPVQSMAAVAASIQNGVRAIGSGGFTEAICQFAEERGSLVIASGTSGVSSALTPVTEAGVGTDVSTLMGMRASQGPDIVAGISSETLVQALGIIQTIDGDWYGFTPTAELRDDPEVGDNLNEIIQAAVWAEARVKVFNNDTDDRRVLDSLNTSNIGYRLSQLSYRRTTTSFNEVPGQYLSTSAASRAFSTNFNGVDTHYTLKFKQMPGITVARMTESQKQALDGNNCNAYISVGGNSMYAEGVMANGNFFDEVHAIDWLQNAVETNAFGTLYTAPNKVAMTNNDVNKIQQNVERALEEAVVNGFAAPGFTQAGIYLAKGYESNAQRVEDRPEGSGRQGPNLSFTLLGAGAIHGIEINGVFER